MILKKQKLTQIFLKALKGDEFSSEEIDAIYLEEKDFKESLDWKKSLELALSQ